MKPPPIAPTARPTMRAQRPAQHPAHRGAGILENECCHSVRLGKRNTKAMRRRHQGESATSQTEAPSCAWIMVDRSTAMPACFAGSAPPAEQQQIARRCFGDRPESYAARRLPPMLPAARFRPVRRIGRRRSGSAPIKLAPHAAHQAEAIAPTPFTLPDAIRRADPAPRGGDDDRARSYAAPAVLSRSSRLRIGRHEVIARHVREAAEVDDLSNLARQVANCLSQPAVTVNASPAAIGSPSLPELDHVRAVDARDARFISLGRPALAPLVQVRRPRVNQPSAKASSPVAVRRRR